MKVWNKAFRIWLDFCPYIKRQLISEFEIVLWIRYLKFDRFFQEDEFKIFLEFLKEAEILCPLVFYKEGKPFPYELNEFSNVMDEEHPIPCYHPLQFFEILNWLNFAPLKKNPYFYGKKWEEYYHLKLLKYRIKKSNKYIKNLKKNRPYSERLEEELDKNPKKDFIYPQGIELLKYLETGHTSRFLTEKTLSTWIKLESLGVRDGAHIYSKLGVSMRYFIKDDGKNNSDDLNKISKKQEDWCKNALSSEVKYLNDEEEKDLMTLHSTLSWIRGEGFFGSFGSVENWHDLFDILPFFKLDEIDGYLSYYINIISFMRYIEHSYWKIFKKMPFYLRDKDKKPYFICETESEWEDYKKGVLNDFGLYSPHPFILCVEGKSEKTILTEYLKHKRRVFSITIMGGIGKAKFYKKLHEETKNFEFFYFFDVHKDIKGFEERKQVYGDRCSFFFPDFVTENFSAEECFNSFNIWLNDIRLSIRKDDKEFILNRLQIEKAKSIEMIKQFNEKKNITIQNSKGFEEIIIGRLKKYKNEIIEYYKNVGVDVKPDEKFKDRIKTELAGRLKLYLSNTFLDNTKRTKKYSFEEKINPFYNIITKILNYQLQESDLQKLMR